MPDRAQPGVYVQELSAFPPSMVGVATAVPVFVGYTAMARSQTSGASLTLKPTLIGSLAEFVALFGGRYQIGYDIAPVSGSAQGDFEAPFTDAANVTFRWFALRDRNGAAAGPAYNLSTAMRLFFANGGGACYVVSVGGYGKQPVGAVDLQAGIAVAAGQDGPTMLVVPDLCLLSGSDYGAVAVQMLRSAGTLQDRIAILDLPGSLDPSGWTVEGLAACRDAFYSAIAPAKDAFSFGTAYAPALAVSVQGSEEFTYFDLLGSAASLTILANLLTTQAQMQYATDASQLSRVTGYITAAFGASRSAQPDLVLNDNLTNTLPLFGQILEILTTRLNVAPPSGAIAGIWLLNDTNNGVWNAPANMALNSTLAPTVMLNDAQQGEYNVPINGNAINIIRDFPNRGSVVWGARTLDGNSEDWRYIQARRTIVYIEQSIKEALAPFVFQANDGKTWGAVVSMVTDFLTSLWTQGGLKGAKASEAFTVQCGLGSTMTGQDIQDGRMIVSVSVQIIRPAEYIPMTIVQEMQPI